MKLIYPEDMKQIDHAAWFHMMLLQGYTSGMGMFTHKPEDTVAETNKKLDEEAQRIYRDLRGYEWVHKVCEMNLIPFSRNSSHHEHADRVDAKIIGTLCEVKIEDIAPFQVPKDRGKAEYYIFLETYQKDALIRPLGVIPCKAYWENCERIPDSDTTVLNEYGRENLLMSLEDFLEILVRDYIPQISEAVGEGMTFKGTGWDRYGVEAADGTLLAGQLPYEIACELILMREILDNKEGVREELRKRATSIYGTLKTRTDPPGQVECIVYAMFDMLSNLRKKWFTPKSHLLKTID